MKKMENSLNKLLEHVDRINDSVSTIYCIKQLVDKITDEQIQALKEMAQGQLDYFSPLKMATMNKQHKLGESNMKVVKALEELKIALKESGRHE